MEQRSIFQSIRRIEREFDEPIREVVAGFIPLGYTRRDVASVLEVSPESMRQFCRDHRIAFPQNQPARTERIRESKRSRAPALELGGQRRSVAEWAELYGIKRSTLHSRLRRGWNPHEALHA